MDIQVILTQDDPKLGKKGQVVKVSPGYAQNFLFPHLKAKPATPSNLKVALDEQRRAEESQRETLEAAQQLADKIAKIQLTVAVAVGESDKLFGAVTWKDIQQNLLSKAIQLEKKHIHLEEPIKKLGDHAVTIKLHPKVITQLKVSVTKKK